GPATVHPRSPCAKSPLTGSGSVALAVASGIISSNAVPRASRRTCMVLAAHSPRLPWLLPAEPWRASTGDARVAEGIDGFLALRVRLRRWSAHDPGLAVV